MSLRTGPMIRKPNEVSRAAFTGVICVAAAVVAVQSLGMPGVAGYMPLIVSIPTLLCALVALIADLRKLSSEGTAAGSSVQPDSGASSSQSGTPQIGRFDPDGEERSVRTSGGLSTRHMYLWLVTLFALMWLVGILVATAVVTVAYMLFVGRERLRTALIVAAVLTGLMVALSLGLGAPSYSGHLTELLTTTQLDSYEPRA